MIKTLQIKVVSTTKKKRPRKRYSKEYDGRKSNENPSGHNMDWLTISPETMSDEFIEMYHQNDKIRNKRPFE